MAEMTHTAYLQLLGEIKEVIEQLSAVEQHKLEAVHAADLPAVDECIRSEQAISLTLRSLENRRAELLKGLGLADVKLSGLAERFPENLRAETTRAAAALRSAYADYTSVSEATRMALERGLREIEQMTQPQLAPAANPAAAAQPNLRPEQKLGQSAPPGDDVPHKKLDFGA